MTERDWTEKSGRGHYEEGHYEEGHYEEGQDDVFDEFDLLGDGKAGATETGRTKVEVPDFMPEPEPTEPVYQARVFLGSLVAEYEDEEERPLPEFFEASNDEDLEVVEVPNMPAKMSEAAGWRSFFAGRKSVGAEIYEKGLEREEAEAAREAAAAAEAHAELRAVPPPTGPVVEGRSVEVAVSDAPDEEFDPPTEVVGIGSEEVPVFTQDAGLQSHLENIRAEIERARAEGKSIREKRAEEAARQAAEEERMAAELAAAEALRREELAQLEAEREAAARAEAERLSQEAMAARAALDVEFDDEEELEEEEPEGAALDESGATEEESLVGETPYGSWLDLLERMETEEEAEEAVEQSTGPDGETESDLGDEESEWEGAVNHDEEEDEREDEREDEKEDEDDLEDLEWSPGLVGGLVDGGETAELAVTEEEATEETAEEVGETEEPEMEDLADRGPADWAEAADSSGLGTSETGADEVEDWGDWVAPDGEAGLGEAPAEEATEETAEEAAEEAGVIDEAEEAAVGEATGETYAPIEVREETIALLLEEIELPDLEAAASQDAIEAGDDDSEDAGVADEEAAEGEEMPEGDEGRAEEGIDLEAGEGVELESEDDSDDEMGGVEIEEVEIGIAAVEVGGSALEEEGPGTEDLGETVDVDSESRTESREPGIVEEALAEEGAEGDLETTMDDVMEVVVAEREADEPEAEVEEGEEDTEEGGESGVEESAVLEMESALAERAEEVLAFKSELAAPFAEAQAAYKEAWEAFYAKEIDTEELRHRTSAIVVWYKGAKWQIGFQSGRWYREDIHDGEPHWSTGKPPTAAEYEAEMLARQAQAESELSAKMEEVSAAARKILREYAVGRLTHDQAGDALAQAAVEFEGRTYRLGVQSGEWYLETEDGFEYVGGVGEMVKRGRHEKVTPDLLSEEEAWAAYEAVLEIAAEAAAETEDLDWGEEE